MHFRMYFDRIRMELSILYFKGSQVDLFKLSDAFPVIKICCCFLSLFFFLFLFYFILFYLFIFFFFFENHHSLRKRESRRQGFKTFFMLNSTENEIKLP